MNLKIFIFFFFSIVFGLYAQEEKDIEYYLNESFEIYRTNPGKALKHLDNAEELLAKTPNDSLSSIKERNYAFIYYLSGDYGKSLSYYLKALDGFKKIKDNANIARCYNGLGLIQQGVGRHHQAIRYFEKYLDFVKSDPSAAYLNLGISYLALSNIEKATNYFNKSSKSALTSSNKSVKLASKNRVAQMHYLKGDYTKAVQDYQKVLSDEDGDNWEFTFAYAGLAECFVEVGDLNQALIYANKSYEIAEKLNALWDMERSVSLISNIYKLQQSYKNAYLFSEKSRKLNDSLFNNEQAKIIAVLQLDKKETENDVLKTQNQIAEEKLLFNKLLATFIGAILIITLFFAFKYKKIIKEKEALNRTLALQNSKLLKIDKGKNKLFSIISHDLRSPVASLSQLIDLLMQEAFSEKEKKEVFSSMRVQLEETSRMLNNLLIWASSQLNGTKVELKKIDLLQEVTRILNVYKVPSKSKGIKIVHQKNIEPISIKADEVQLHVILHNLLSNALKFTPKQKEIRISYKRIETKIELHIFNEGKPISEVKVNKILEENLTFSSSVGTAGEVGSGLGFLLIKKYILLNNAEFSIIPIENEGTLAILRFDIRK